MYRLLNKIENLASLALGKGFGAKSISTETKRLKKFLTYPKLGLDIGGNIGEYTANLRSAFPDMEIHLFEPAKTNLDKLNQRFGTDAKISIAPYALSDKTGIQDLFSDSPGSGLGSLSKRRLDHFGINQALKDSVNVLRFEEYWEDKLQMREIDLAKIDVEGHELAVLNGFGKAIHKTRVIQFEFGGCNIDTRTYFQDFWYFFKEHGFDIHRITPFGLEAILHYKESHETFLNTNYLCRNNRLG